MDMQRFVVPRIWAASLAALGVIALSASAMAGGFASARLGGLHGNAVSISPTSIYWNPGAIGKIEGSRLYLDGMFAVRHSSFTATAADPANSGRNTLGDNGNNFIVSPAVAFTTDFGGSNVVLGAGFYVPFGGQSVWGKVDVPEGSPGFVQDGPQRWYNIDGKIQQMTGTLGAAVRTNDKTFSAGLMLNLNIFKIDTLRARNPDGTDDVLHSDGSVKEGRSRMDVSSVDMSIGLGAHWNSLDQRWAVGASWQSGPNISGGQTLKGDLTNQFGPGPRNTSRIAVRQHMPHIARLGLAYRFVKDPVEEGDDPVVKGELRLGAEIQTWNQFKSQCIVQEAALDEHSIQDICKTDASGVVEESGELVQNLVRDWRLSYGVKLSGSYYLNDRIEIGAGIGYDSNAIPDYTMDPALMDMNKIAFDLGGNFQVAKWLAIMVQFTEVFYITRDTTGNPGVSEGYSQKNAQPSPGGRYTQNIFITNLGLHFSF